MSADLSGDDRKQPRYEFDRHTPEYRHQFEAITQEMQANCPLAWSDTHGGHWVAAGNREVFELARAQREYRQALDPYLSPAAVARWLPVAAGSSRACGACRPRSGPARSTARAWPRPSRPCSGPVTSSGWPNRSPCARPRRISAYDAVGSGLGCASAAVCSAHISARACGATRHSPGKFR